MALTTNSEDDIIVDSEEALRNAMNSATEGQTIVLSGDMTIGDTLAVVRPGVSFAIDLAGHTINRNLTEQDEDNNGHVLDVNKGTLVLGDSSAEQSGKIAGGFDENGGGVVIGGKAQLAASDWPMPQKMIDEAADGATLKLARDWRAWPHPWQRRPRPVRNGWGTWVE